MKIKDLKEVCDEYVILYRVGGKYITEGSLKDLKDCDNETIYKIYFNKYNGIEIFLESKEWLNE